MSVKYFTSGMRDIAGAPGIANAMMDAFAIAQGRISRSRLADDPPEVVVNARLCKVGLFDFHRADELIAIGREAARGNIERLQGYVLCRPRRPSVAAAHSMARARQAAVEASLPGLAPAAGAVLQWVRNSSKLDAKACKA